MQQDQNKGSITVFLAVNFLFIMALLGTLIDGARMVEVKSQLYDATDLAATSALAQFNTKLKDRYGLFGFEGNPDAVLNQIVKQNLSPVSQGELSSSEELYQYIYNSVLQAVGTSDPIQSKPFDLLQLQNPTATRTTQPITLLNRNEFERQIFEYVKFRGPVELGMQGISLDFEEIDQELTKAQNEDSADQAMRKLEDMLAEHVEDQGKYNVKMEKFRDDMARIKENFFHPIEEHLRESPSLDSLLLLKDQMQEFSDEIEVSESCMNLMKMLNELTESYNKLIEACGQTEQRFTGSGENAAFDGKPISGDMLIKYRDDISLMKQHAELKWGQASSAGEEEKYNAIVTAIPTIRSKVLEFQEEIEELEKFAGAFEDSDHQEDIEDALMEGIVQTWEHMEDHFEEEAPLYGGGTIGFFYQAERLQQLLPNYQTGGTDSSKEWKQAAEQAIDRPDSRAYDRVIPDAYSLPNTLGEDQFNEALSLSLDTDFSQGMSLDSAKEAREGNQKETDAIKSLFQGIGDFALSTLDNSMLGIYALGNFQNTLCFAGNPPANYSHGKVDLSRYSINMRNDPIEDSSIFFDDCEVEYLIRGDDSEKKNYQGIRNELTGIYFVLNIANIRRTKTVSSAIETTARAVQATVTGATLGLGAGAGVIAYYATREACYASLAALQTAHDLDRLYFGNKVPLIKKNDQDFCGLPKLLAPYDCAEKNNGKLPIGYTDYLFFRMVLTPQDTLRGRLQNLVEINMNTSGENLNTARPFQLYNAQTSVTVSAQATMPFFFINALTFMGDYDGVGMKLSACSSQKY